MKIEPTSKINTDMTKQQTVAVNKNTIINNKDDSFESLLINKMKQTKSQNLSPQQLLSLDGLILNDEEIKVLKSILDQTIL